MTHPLGNPRSIAGLQPNTALVTVTPTCLILFQTERQRPGVLRGVHAGRGRAVPQPERDDAGVRYDQRLPGPGDPQLSGGRAHPRPQTLLALLR